MAKDKKPAAEKTAENKFAKESLIKSRKYAGDKDLLSALLGDGKTYTIAETDKAIEDYRNKEVK